MRRAPWLPVVALWHLLADQTTAIVITFQNTTFPQYESVAFALGPVPYHVVNRSVVAVSSTPHLSPQVPASLTGRVLVFQDGDISSLVDQCAAAGCAGLLQCMTPHETSAEVHVWAWVYRSAKVPFSTVPTAFVVSRTACQLLYELPQSDIRVSFSSSEFANPMESAVTSVPALLCFYASTMLNIVSIVMSIYKLLSFMMDSNWNLRPIPRWPLLVMSNQVIASAMRVIFAGNTAFARVQGIPYSVYRLTVTGYLPFHLASTMFVGLAMHETLYKGSTLSNRHRWTLAVFMWILGAIFALDFASTLYASISLLVLFDTMLISAIYLVLNVVCSIFFIRYGTTVARSLLANQTISEGERHRRIHFAKRVAISGVIGIIVLICQLLFQFLHTASPLAYVVTYTLATVAATCQGILFQLAFRARNSIFNRSTQPQGTHVATSQK
ncbi:unnamed protein product (mitochondrion) [Plasmodiophora brassicae]|nr:unnamed protein product [Plasmodiophora brassicae]